MTTNERRFFSRAPRLETRADGSPVIAGYGAVFYDANDPGTEFHLWGEVYERFMPGAFDEALRSDDVRSFFNHDPSKILGRTSAGTLTLSVDRVGLRYEVEPPDTQYAKDLLESLRRGDVSGASIIFDLPRSERSRVVIVEEGDRLIRQVEACKLYEVGPVSLPAYEATTAGLRSGDRERIEAELAEARKRKDAISEIDVRRDAMKFRRGLR